ncbi:hypothetical protein GCM10025862_14840 [Arsenicicoccus piscis]|uniref:GH15-like domain-containing protein n=1 Tax=Arsenicicoccus piscis TaxID=673954 RepID=A0ABQ6HP62_9MICO|nr:hypothetical protein GCM10025862_14840 [Arsenicicoccus piscis]
MLDTDWTTPAGSVTTTDFLTHGKDDSNDPGVGVVRRVECTAGSVDVEVDLVMRFDYGRTAPWVRRTHDPSGAEVVRATAGPHSLTLHGPRLTGRDATHHGRFHLEAGQTLTWSLTWRPSHLAVPVAPDVDAELAWLTRTWRRWRDEVDVQGRYAEEVNDSLAVLRALTLHSTGGIVAAPTTSLPEAIGGERNWDYRYTWLRDSAFTIDALASHGHVHVAAHWRDWLLRAIAGDPEDLQIMYGVAGERDLPESTLDHLAGYHASRPVRVGNGAYVQY